jgi:hypothetical protein
MPLLLAVLAVPASAQDSSHPHWVATPYGHINAGDVENRRGGLGLSAAWVPGPLGVELDIDRHIHFFKDARIDLVENNCGVAAEGATGPCVDLDTDAWIFMGNAVVPIPTGGSKWRPYGVVGLGVVYAWVNGGGDDIDTSQVNPALDLGGGVVYWFNGWFGLRGDLRYFHGFVSDGQEGVYDRDYDFGRLALGVSFGVPRSPR